MRSEHAPRLRGLYAVTQGAADTGALLARVEAALAANLARGLDIGDAVFEAQDYTWHALQHALRPGMGQYLPDRLFWARESEDGDGK